MRTLFIGDVHGCYDELMELVTKIGLMPEDHLYFVGDLVNKWPKSLEVVQFVKNRPNTWSVLGNHEYFLMCSLEEQKAYFDRSPHISTERQWWIRTEYQAASLNRSLLEQNHLSKWVSSLPVYIEKENFILVHGWLHPDFWLETPSDIATMIRMYEGKPWYEYYTGEKKVIYGHWAVDGLRIRENTIWLDTGCCFGGHLTAYCLESGEIWQVHAHDIYKIPADHKWKIEKIKSGN